MINLKITITEKGKRIANFNNELEKAMNQSMNKSLEFTRKTLAKNAPYRQYTANNPAPPVHNYHLRGYLKDPAKCVRRERLGSAIIYGEIWFNEKWVPQIRHVIKEMKSWPNGINPSSKPYLVFYWTREGRWFKGLHVNRKNLAGSNFITNSYNEVSPRIKGIFDEEIYKLTLEG